MLNRINSYTCAVISTYVASCTPISSGGNSLYLQDHLGVTDVEKNPIQNIASSIIGRSKGEVESIQNYIEFNHISPISNDEILVPGDGALGTFHIKRITSDGDVWFHVNESGIEEEADEYEASVWRLQNGRWQVRNCQ